MSQEEAIRLHADMLEQPGHLYTQGELEALLPHGSRDKLIDFLQALIDQQLVRLARSDSTLYYEAVANDEAEKIRRMSPDEAMVYSYIKEAGREGIWTRAIKMKGNLHQNVVMRCLKSLESQRYIKSVKSVKFPTRKIYMLYQLQPSIEVTGGPWFTDSELDTEFISLLLRLVWQYIARASFPDAEAGAQQRYLPGYAGYPSVDDIYEFVTTSGVSTVELGNSDISSLCDVLLADDKVEQLPSGRFKATWSSILAEQGVPTPASQLPKNVLPLVSQFTEES